MIYMTIFLYKYHSRINYLEVKYMKKGITEGLQISIATFLVAIGVAMPKMSTVPVGDDLIFGYWLMFLGLIIPISLGILLCIQSFSEKQLIV